MAPPVGQVFEDRQGVADQTVGASALEVGNGADAAVGVFERRIPETGWRRLAVLVNLANQTRMAEGFREVMPWPTAARSLHRRRERILGGAAAAAP